MQTDDSEIYVWKNPKFYIKSKNKQIRELSVISCYLYRKLATYNINSNFYDNDVDFVLLFLFAFSWDL